MNFDTQIVASTSTNTRGCGVSNLPAAGATRHANNKRTKAGIGNGTSWLWGNSANGCTGASWLLLLWRLMIEKRSQLSFTEPEHRRLELTEGHQQHVQHKAAASLAIRWERSCRSNGKADSGSQSADAAKHTTNTWTPPLKPRSWKHLTQTYWSVSDPHSTREQSRTRTLTGLSPSIRSCQPAWTRGPTVIMLEPFLPLASSCGSLTGLQRSDGRYLLKLLVTPELATRSKNGFNI